VARALRTLLGWLISAYCWAGLLVVTVFFYLLARVLELLRGPEVYGPLFRRWARVIVLGGPFDYRVEGEQHSTFPAILAVNHRSIFDIALITATVPAPVYFIARDDLLKVPLLGSSLKRCGHILVGKNGSSGTQAMAREVMDRIERGGRVVVFPEGTRSPDDRVRRFGAGAFRLARMAGCPLVPVAMTGSADVIAKGSRLLCPAKVTISFLEPRVLTEEDSRSQEYREAVRSLVDQTVQRLRAGAGVERSRESDLDDDLSLSRREG
jgi:1-acyl-sn-glycerol-3-phosphate acyltransferase